MPDDCLPELRRSLFFPHPNPNYDPEPTLSPSSSWVTPVEMLDGGRIPEEPQALPARGEHGRCGGHRGAAGGAHRARREWHGASWGGKSLIAARN